MKSTNENIKKNSSKLNTVFLFVKTSYFHLSWPHCISPPLLFHEQRVESQGSGLRADAVWDLESVNKVGVAKGLMRVEKHRKRETKRYRFKNSTQSQSQSQRALSNTVYFVIAFPYWVFQLSIFWIRFCGRYFMRTRCSMKCLCVRYVLFLLVLFAGQENWGK